MSAGTAHWTPVSVVEMSAAVHEGLAAPLFSYQATVSSSYDAETMSRSPSPSMSATYTLAAPSAEVAMSAAVHEGSAAPSFSYHAMVSSKYDAETMSRSPSPSMSATYTDFAPEAEVAMSVAVHEGLAAPSFSYHAIVLSDSDAETMSRSPSSSMSATWTDIGLSAEVATTFSVHDGFAAPSFSYHAMVSSPEDAETMSRSPSPSMSPTYVVSAFMTDVPTVEPVHAGFAMKRFEVGACPVSYSKVMLVIGTSTDRSAPSTLGVSSR